MSENDDKSKLMDYRDPQTSAGQNKSDTEDDAVDDGLLEAQRSDSSDTVHPSAESTAVKTDEINVAGRSSHQLDMSSTFFKELSLLNAVINRLHTHQLRQQLRELELCTAGKKPVLKKRLKNFHRIQKMAEENLEGVKMVPYDYLLVIDFKSTCKDNNDDFDHEIIQFPAVLLDVEDRKFVGTFRELCKPVINPELTEFCVRMTGVTQSEVDGAEPFPEILERFNRWLIALGLKKRTFCVVTDGSWDIRFLLSKQCGYNQLPMPVWSRQWINMRKTFSNFYDTPRLSLSAMLQLLGMKFDGQINCGLHDTKNIARILCQMIDDGCAIKINEKIDQMDYYMPRHPTATANIALDMPQPTDDASAAAAGSSQNAPTAADDTGSGAGAGL